MSATIFAGSMEFVTVSLLCGAFNPVYAFLLALMVNARHLFYGISMLSTSRAQAGKMVPNLRNVRRIFLHSLFHKAA